MDNGNKNDVISEIFKDVENSLGGHGDSGDDDQEKIQAASSGESVGSVIDNENEETVLKWVVDKESGEWVQVRVPRSQAARLTFRSFSPGISAEGRDERFAYTVCPSDPSHPTWNTLMSSGWLPVPAKDRLDRDVVIRNPQHGKDVIAHGDGVLYYVPKELHEEHRKHHEKSVSREKQSIYSDDAAAAVAERAGIDEKSVRNVTEPIESTFGLDESGNVVEVDEYGRTTIVNHVDDGHLIEQADRSDSRGRRVFGFGSTDGYPSAPKSRLNIPGRPEL